MNQAQLVELAKLLDIKIKTNGGYYISILCKDMTDDAKEKLFDSVKNGKNEHSVTRSKWQKTGHRSNANYGEPVKVTIFSK